MATFAKMYWRGYGVACILTVLLVVLAGCSDRRSEQFRAEGDTLRGLDRIGAARQAYESALEANPDNHMAKLGLARCEVAEGDIDGALVYFQEALDLDVGLEEAYAEAISALLGVGRMEEALALSGEYAAQAPEAGGTTRGVVLMQMERYDEAIESLESLAQSYPESGTVQIELGAALLAGGRVEEAEALFKKQLDGEPAMSVAARMGLVDVYRTQGRMDDMLAELAALVEIRPDDLALKLSYARALLLNEQGEEAESVAREVLAVNPESGWANYVVGYQKVVDGALEEATAFLEQAERALPEEEQIEELLAYAASGGEGGLPGMPGQSADGADGAPGQPESAAPLTWKDLWKQAALNRLLDNRAMYIDSGGDPAREVLALAALFTFQAGLAGELASALPEDSHVRVYVEAFLQRDPELVAEKIQAWKSEDSEAQAMRDNALGFAMVAGGKREQGLSVFLFCLERWPDHGVALFNIAQVFRRLGQPIIAAQNLQRLIGMYPENIDAHQMHYTALREGQSYENARRAAEASYTLFPDERWSHLYLCQAYLDTGDLEMALQLLDRAASKFPGDPELQAIRARVLTRTGDCEQAESVLTAISTTSPAVISARDTLRALCRAVAGDLDGAAAIASEREPAARSDSLALLLAASLAGQGDMEVARAALRPEGAEQPFAGKFGLLLETALGAEGTELKPDEAAWARQLGEKPALLVDYTVVVALQLADLNDQAWSYYQANLADEPPHIALAQLAYRSLGNSDRVEDAGALARQVAESLPDDPRAWLGLASVLKALDDTEGEVAAVKKALETGPREPEALFQHAVLMERQGNLEQAVANYRTLVEVAPESGAANNNLAYTLLLLGGNDEEALTHAKKAAEAIPRDAGVLHTLGLAQMRTGNLEESRNNLKRAVEIDPANPTIMFDYGRLLADMDEKEEARKRVQYAIAMSQNAGVDFPQEAEAESLLQALQP